MILLQQKYCHVSTVLVFIQNLKFETQVLAIISILAALLLISISGIKLYELQREFDASQSEQSSASSARHKREKAEYAFRVGVFATQV